MAEKKTAADKAGEDMEDFVQKLAGAGYRPAGNAQSGYSLSQQQVTAGDDRVTMLKGQADYYEDLVKNGRAEVERLTNAKTATEVHRKLHGTEMDANGVLLGTADTAAIEEYNKQIRQQTGLIADARDNLQSIETAVAEAQDTAKILHSANQTLSDLFAALGTSTNAFKSAQSQGAADSAAENLHFATEKTEARLKGESKFDIANNALAAEKELAAMKAQTGYTPEQWKAGGSPQQKAYVKHLEDQVTALQDMETALGANGPAIIELLQSILTHHGDLTAFVYGLQAQLNATVYSIPGTPSAYPTPP